MDAFVSAAVPAVHADAVAREHSRSPTVVQYEPARRRRSMSEPQTNTGEEPAVD
jgi:hypothetical protein